MTTNQDQQPVAIYTSFPAKSYKIGKYQFEDGTLKFYSQKEADEFDKVIAGAGIRVRTFVKKISLEAADRVAQRVLKDPGAHTGPQTSDTMRMASQIAADRDKQLQQTVEEQQAAAAAAVEAQGVKQPEIPPGTTPVPQANPESHQHNHTKPTPNPLKLGGK